jgi:hypothetical protein
MNIVTVNILRSEHGTLMGEMRNNTKIFWKTCRKKNYAKEENKMDLKEMGCVNMDWI